MKIPTCFSILCAIYASECCCYGGCCFGSVAVQTAHMYAINSTLAYINVFVCVAFLFYFALTYVHFRFHFGIFFCVICYDQSVIVVFFLIFFLLSSPVWVFFCSLLLSCVVFFHLWNWMSFSFPVHFSSFHMNFIFFSLVLSVSVLLFFPLFRCA